MPRPSHSPVSSSLLGPNILLSTLFIKWFYYPKSILAKRFYQEPGWLSRYSDWLRAGRQRGRSSSPGRGEIFLSSTASRPVPEPTQPPIQWVPGALSSGLKRPGQEYVDLYIHSPIRLHGVVLN
jgi:hypothetical protein